MVYRIQKRRYNIGKYARMASTAYGTYRNIRNRLNAGRSYTRTNTKRGTSGTGVTRQHDFKNQYYKKRMPRYKKRKWVSFVKKVRAVHNKDLGTKTIVFNNTKSNTVTSSTTQAWDFFTLYGVNGNSSGNELGTGDLNTIFQNCTLSTVNMDKITFKSAVLDLTFANTGTTKLEVDLYHWTFWGKGRSLSFTDASVSAATQTGTDDPNGLGNLQALQILQRGVTPFDMPALIRNLQATIVKKVKYFIEVGDTITYQIRDPKEHVISENDVNLGNINNLAQPRLTQGVLFIAKPITGGGFAGTAWSIGATRKYAFTQVDAFDADGYKQI